MSLDPTLALQEAVYAALAASTDLQALVDDHIYDVAPEDAALPYIIYGDADITTDYEAGADFLDCTAIIEIWTEAATRKEGLLILKAVVAALDDHIEIEGFITAEAQYDGNDQIPDLGDGLRRIEAEFTYKVLAKGDAPVEPDPLTITGSPLLTVAPGVVYSFAPVVSGGVQPYSFALAGSLPTGLTFNDDDGSISGTVADPGADTTYGPLTITVQDDDGVSASLTSFSILVDVEEPDPLVISGTPATAADVGDLYSFTPTVSGGVAPYTFSLSGTLPPGLTFDPATGAITGTLTDA